MAQAVGISHGAVQNGVARVLDGSSAYKKRSGLSRKTTAQTDRCVEMAAIHDRRVSLRQLQGDLSAVTDQVVSWSLLSTRLF